MKRILRYAVRSLLGAILVVVLATGLLVGFGLHEDIAKSDVALVLGNTVAPNGQPSPRLRARLDRTLELYQAGYFPQVIVSGGVGKEGFDEAVVMRDYLVAKGVPMDKVIVDSAGLTTYASAQNTRKIARTHQFKSVLVVSQYFHVPRSRLALQKFGIAEVHSAYARFFEKRDFYSAPRELLGYVSYLFKSYGTGS